MSAWPWTERKVAQRCPHPGCSRPPLDDNCRCEVHTEAHREANAASMRRSRKMKRAQLVLVGVG